MKIPRSIRSIALVIVAATIIVGSRNPKADTAVCGGVNVNLPFTDIAGNVFFCQIAAAYFSGLTNGTTATTYGPGDLVTRDQMAAFVTRTMDQSVKRASRRAALNQFWTNQGGNTLALISVGSNPTGVRSDGADLWVANAADGTVSRVRASDGRLLETWTGAVSGGSVLIAMGRVFVTGLTTPGSLYEIDPTQPAGTVSLVTNGLGDIPYDIGFDGQRIWVANEDNSGSLSVVTLNPVTVTTITTGISRPSGIVYDGTNIWITEVAASNLKKLDSSGNVLMTVHVASFPQRPVFDGTNIWVPCNGADKVIVVRATGSLAGTVVATLTGNGMFFPHQAAFDGERILVTNDEGNSVSLWRASDRTPIGTFSTGAFTRPTQVCSDGLNFWISLSHANKLARF